MPPNNPLQGSVNDKVHPSMAPRPAPERGRYIPESVRAENTLCF
jgi:hypothetical protein